ncbi:hypothetical protein KAFR_0C03280 [Kazachstania africana CBS 2517]|uniref:Uncharacterized protein n=1 Tax=Kazachstania africana (strain ATCC 22294 / BCRC 22015 / CBS 2517 / CECT 1963 / NBRC 1671 / NRRL Y-8276) TaxID=1071382 RepID=H2ASH0_KAZAF|nr:hypothetical protein KAFR_0C03280 [Kazachstania africana CBS 2517]CCF57320.1 hypothetical protein KAFR_0C03280 [Kazachstania africana CBS 2517]
MEEILSQLVDKTKHLLEERIEKNYRICLVIVGPPGSGKSTIAEKLCLHLNKSFNEYLLKERGTFSLRKGGLSCDDLVKGVDEIDPVLQGELEINGGLLPDKVEDTNFKPVKVTNKSNSSLLVVGRGGLPNSIEITMPSSPDILDNREIDIAQIVPMDGFHLTRSCLDKFQCPEEAHSRRGSPPTFDSNNFSELCRILADSSKIEPPSSMKSGIWEKVLDTFLSDVPTISIPGFDHAVKDPTRNALCVDRFTRILILEGLYLLYEKENWQKIYAYMSGTDAVIFLYLDVDEHIIEERVANRHLASGLVASFEEGVAKFRANDLLNAHAVRDNLIESENIIKVPTA